MCGSFLHVCMPFRPFSPALIFSARKSFFFAAGVVKYEKYGFSSAAEMIESKSDEYLRSYVRRKVILNRIKETASITENESMPFLDDSMY